MTTKKSDAEPKDKGKGPADAETPPAPAAAAPASERFPVEDIAARRGLMPQFSAGVDGRVARTAEGVGQLVPGRARKANRQYWKYAAAKALFKWKPGQEMTEAEFDAAITKATTTPL